MQRADLGAGRALDAALARMDTWRGRDVSLEPLPGGFLHRSFIVRVDGEPHVVKLLNPELDDLIIVPIDQVISNTVEAGRIGVGARVLAAFPDIPALVLEFIDGETLDVSALQRPGIIQEVARTARRLHRECQPFGARYDIFQWLERWTSLGERTKARMPTGYQERLPRIAEIQRAVQGADRPLVPCHNDLLAENILHTQRGVRLIDYDFSGLNDPCFELGDIVAEGEFDEEQAELLSTAYFDLPSDADRARVQLYAIVSNFTYGLLAAVFMANYPHLLDPDFDMWQYVMAKWERASAALDQPSTEELLRVAARKD
jgi:thiamine kinase-like enzyme